MKEHKMMETKKRAEERLGQGRREECNHRGFPRDFVRDEDGCVKMLCLDCGREVVTPSQRDRAA